MLHVRVLAIPDPAEVAESLRDLDLAPPELDALCRQIVHRTLKLSGLDSALAVELFRLSADLGLTAIAGRSRPGDLILSGSLAQFDLLLGRLAGIEGGPAAIQAIRRALNAFCTDPPPTTARGHRFDFAGRVYVLGILNFTPDSFYDRGRYFDCARAVERGLQMVEEGADIVEVGGQTAQPKKPAIPEAEEIERVAPLIEALAGRGIPVAVDTYRLPVVRAALDAGAAIVNDIGGLADPAIGQAAAAADAMLVIMHIKNRPKVDFHQPEHRWSLEYGSLLDDVATFLAERVEQAVATGLPRERIILDPGLGFDKLYRHDVEILHRLAELRSLGHPLLLATSRKNFVGELLDLPIEELLAGTAAAVAYGVAQGASIIRVHDVAFMAQVVRLTEFLARRRPVPPMEQMRLWR